VLTSTIEESCSCLCCFNALISDCEQFCHRLRLLHDDLFDSLEICHAIAEGIDHFYILDVWDHVPGVAKALNIVTNSFSVLLLDNLQSLCHRGSLIHSLEVPNECGAELVQSLDFVLGQVDEL
jgi:hypothetical protein